MFDIKKYSNNIAIITDQGDCVSYKELFDLQEEFFKMLNERDLVLILCDNVLGSLIGYIGCIVNKVVPILINCDIHKDTLNNLLKSYKPNYIWMPDHSDLLEYTTEVYKRWDYKLIPYMVNKSFDIYEELALLLPTSGSTGANKMVRISYENIKENAKSIIQYLNINNYDRAVTSLPMCYSFGLSVINTHLYSGACVLLTNKKVIDNKFWLFFNSYGGTSISGVPYTYSVMRKMNITNTKLPTLKVLTQAGGKLSTKDCKFFLDYARKNNCSFYVMYGQTEATARISYVPCDILDEKIGSIGISVPNGSMEVHDMEDNKITYPYSIGELVYKGKNVSLGYAYDFKDLVLPNENNYVLYTGDLVYFDNDGVFYHIGRKDRTVKILGLRVSLDELEKVLEDKFKYQFICMYVDSIIYIICDEKSIDSTVIEYVCCITKLNSSLFKYIFLDKIPHIYNGKIDYEKIKQLLL